MSNLLSKLSNPKRIGLFTFEAKCPNCENQLKATKKEFHCNECNKKGDPKDYQKWLWELDQKKITHLMEKGLDSKEMSNWWMNRY
jgi:hypothetical protein